MPGIIEGYNYDIFISYRQKDNKHDGWVSEFVNQLKGELESTFKEDISIYFDENPHDGLLETHNVDKSLEDKLKCLIFIPIISQTYCDPKSFAWQHEFCAFNKLAKEDILGRDVKLGSGNVASRILPVKIHDLDPEDTKLLEDELGEVLRGIEFIYKEAGVNRPLKPDDDVKENLNKTNYRNQINKVANAVKEIISALKKHDQKPEVVSQKVSAPVNPLQKSKKTPIILTSVVALPLIILGIIFIPKLFKPSEELEKSIAILPFRNDSPDQEMYFINGVMEEILDNLCKIEDLRVVSRSSVEQYRNDPKPIPVVAEEMDVAYVLEGSGQRDGDNIRLTVQLLDAKKDQHIWSDSYYREIKNIFELQSEIAQIIAAEIEAIITPEEQQLIDKVPTTNLTAFDFYQRGREELNNGNFNRAEDLFREALSNDPSFAEVYVGMANVHFEKRNLSEYYSENYLDSMLILVNKALTLDNQLSEAYSLRGRYYEAFGKNDQALADIEKAIKLNPNNGEAYYTQALLYRGSNDFVKSLDNFHKAININRGQELNSYLKELAWEYFAAGFVDKSTHYFNEALKLDGDSADYFWALGYCNMFQGNYQTAIDFLQRSVALGFRYAYGSIGFSLLGEGKYKEALEAYEKWIEYLKESNDLSFNNAQRIAYAYYVNGFEKEAEDYFDLLIEYSLGDINSNRRLVYKLFGYYDLAGVYAFRGEKEKAYKNLRLFSQIEEVPYWMAILIKNDELFDSIRNEPEFQQIVRDVEAKFQAGHERVRKWLEEQGML